MKNTTRLNNIIAGIDDTKKYRGVVYVPYHKVQRIIDDYFSSITHQLDKTSLNGHGLEHNEAFVKGLYHAELIFRDPRYNGNR